MLKIYHSAHYHLMRDSAIVIMSILLAWVLVRVGIIQTIVSFSLGMKLLGSFVAGLFFTSVFTTSFAIVALGGITQTNSIVLVALLGALGATIGDLVLFRFVKNDITEDIKDLIQLTHYRARLSHIYHRKIFRYLTPLVGALIIASPLPDELGIMMLGLSRVRTSWFIPTSFFFNFVGIVIIGIVAKTIA